MDIGPTGSLQNFGGSIRRLHALHRAVKSDSGARNTCN